MGKERSSSGRSDGNLSAQSRGRRLQASVAAAIAFLLTAGVIGFGGTRAGPDAATAATTNTTTLPGPNCSRTSVGFTPLSDLGQGTYRGFQGGLYPGGSNTPPSAYLKAGLAAAGQVRPLARNGAPSSSGRIVLLSIGMSNAYLEYAQFIQATSTHFIANGDLVVGGTLSKGNPHVTLVNGATPNFDAEKIVNNQASYLGIVDTDLADSGVTPDQVQAVWLNEAIGNEHEAFPTDSQHLERDLNTIISMLTASFPNLRLVYISSRIYAGYAVTSLNPEPFAYESGFAVKWTVAGTIAHPGTRPWVAWGPYTWADGTIPRSDGLEWLCSDFESDGTHPSLQGAAKVGSRLAQFFTTDPTTRTWFDALSP